VLTLNGDRVAGSGLEVATEVGTVTQSYTMHAVIWANAGDLLKLVSLSGISLETSTAANVFTLTIARVN
jgi:hypothetical protein